MSTTIPTTVAPGSVEDIQQQILKMVRAYLSKDGFLHYTELIWGAFDELRRQNVGEQRVKPIGWVTDGYFKNEWWNDHLTVVCGEWELMCKWRGWANEPFTAGALKRLKDLREAGKNLSGKQKSTDPSDTDSWKALALALKEVFTYRDAVSSEGTSKGDSSPEGDVDEMEVTANIEGYTRQENKWYSTVTDYLITELFRWEPRQMGEEDEVGSLSEYFADGETLLSSAAMTGSVNTGNTATLTIDTNSMASSTPVSMSATDRSGTVFSSENNDPNPSSLPSRSIPIVGHPGVTFSVEAPSSKKSSQKKPKPSTAC